MDTVAAAITPIAPAAAIFGWRRLRVVLVACFAVSVLALISWTGSYRVLIGRLLVVGLSLLLVFGVLERWPRRLPPWIARWAVQVGGVAVAVPFAIILAYILSSIGYDDSFWQDKSRLQGMGLLLGFSWAVAPWIAVSALFNQITGQARNQALAFELERSELERRAVEGRMRLLQAQVEPHFLFNTLANVRELVDQGSPQASAVLASLIAYLRAAVPRLHEGGTMVAQEIDLVRAYLEVMHMRMPDRLQFVLHVDDAALPLLCPPMALLTLVENAVRHGIDPGEEGGRIEVRVGVANGRVRAQVIDTGVGLRATGASGAGTGLANLRERLKLVFGDSAQLRLAAVQPHGVSAEIEFPARSAAA